MGRTKGPYTAEYAAGDNVKIASRSTLEQFLRTWKYHNKLKPEQLAYADVIAEVVSIGFYHGGDELYGLKGVPGIWHEACLERATPDRVGSEAAK